MSIRQSIAIEVETAANKCGPEIIILLMEKWDREIERLKDPAILNLAELLGSYTRLKITLHHAIKRMDRELSRGYNHTDHYDVDTIRLRMKAKEARVNYYDAKLRIERQEGKHGIDCTCRGCKCIGKFGG